MTTQLLLAGGLGRIGITGSLLGDPPEPNLALGLLALTFGVVAIAGSWAVWRGWEPPKVAAWIRENGYPLPNPAGSFTQYQSPLGAGYLTILCAPAFLAIGLGQVWVAATGSDHPAWLWSLAGYLLLLFIPFVIALMAYFWIGVPDSFRPPAQRGWEIVDGTHRLVRQPEYDR